VNIKVALDPGIMDKTGCDWSRAWIWLFSSTLKTRALLSEERVSPTMSRTLSITMDHWKSWHAPHG